MNTAEPYLDEISPIHSQRQDNPLSKRCATLWPVYMNDHAPIFLDQSIRLHNAVVILQAASKQPFFNKIFTVCDAGKQIYEVSLDYERTLSQLESWSTDPSVKDLLALIHTLANESTTIVQAAGLVLHQHLETVKARQLQRVYLNIVGYPLTSITSIRGNMVDFFVGFEAIILKVYQTKLLPLSLQFTCSDCKTQQVHYLVDGNYSTPAQCRSQSKRECRSKMFTMNKDSLQMLFAQRIKVQQIDPEGRLPRQIVCELRDKLVGRVITGQTIHLYGIVRTETTDERDKKLQGIFTPYVVVNSLIQRAGKASLGYQMALIQRIKSKKRIFGTLIKSFCPNIYGHQLVKAGLLLAMIGGSNRNLNDESTFRETSHVLLLGDPGIGKSQLLKFAVEVLPHSVYVNATASTTSGLTVAVNKDGNDHSLEAGALILADNGICAIDQFDKASDMSALLEVMEQQTISIAKAGIICQLKCRVGIIASANPTSGCYNLGKSFKDNTKISNAILSRFDLIFLLVDKPDPNRDRKLSQHIMKIHSKSRKISSDPSTGREVWPQSSSVSQYGLLANNYLKQTEDSQTLSLEELKKYLYYVRNEVHPAMSREALQIIKGFYLALRENTPSGSFQITNRQLESLVRLAMARAKIECRNLVTEQDALEVTRLMQESLFDSFEEMGYNVNSLKNQVRKNRIEKRVGELSLPKQRALFINTLHQLAEEKEQPVWEWAELVKVAKDLTLNIGDFYAFIERLNVEGVLLQRGSKRYALQKTHL